MKPAQLNHYLSKVQTLCMQNNERFTDNRRHILAALAKLNEPVGAYQLLDLVKNDLPSAKPATVYRALEFFIALGLVHRIDSSNQYLICNHAEDKHDAQFLICDTCGSVQELEVDSGLIRSLQNRAKSHGFRVGNHSFEVHGQCAGCQN